MTFKLKLSKKNQGAIPVSVLRELGLEPNQENDLIIYKNLNGEYVIATPLQMFNKMKGSLANSLSKETKEKLSKMTTEEITTEEKKALIQAVTEKAKSGKI